MKAYKPKRHYRWHPGFIAWLLHRLSGVALAGYLLLHLWVLQNLAKGPAEFDQIMAMFDTLLVKVMEVGLLGVVAYHTINGLRIVFMDFGPMAEKEKYIKYLAGAFAVVAIIIIVGGASMLSHALSR